MSTSISLAISQADPESHASKSFCDLRKPAPSIGDCLSLRPDEWADSLGQPYERRHTGLGSTTAEPIFPEFDPSKLKKWRHRAARSTKHHNADGTSSSIGKVSIKDDNFYEQVDLQMSRNSFDYPDHQNTVNYIDEWLEDANQSTRSKSFDEDMVQTSRGNVIGIRGFSSDNYLYANKRQRENYEKLKGEYIRLQSNYGKLHNHLTASSHKFKELSREKDKKLDALRLLVERQSQQLRNIAHGDVSAPTCKHHHLQEARCEHELEIIKLRDELIRLEGKLAESGVSDKRDLIESLKCDKKKLSDQVEMCKLELEQLKRQFRDLSNEHTGKTILTLCNENARLKDTNETDVAELQLLRDNFSQLESRLLSLCEEQKLCAANGEQSEEHARILIELCRLQVYQPKLEMIIETERKIKLELRSQIDGLRQENDKLSEKLTQTQRELVALKSHSKKVESSEVAMMQADLSQWQEKCNRLKREKLDVEEMLRVSKLRVSQMESRHQNEINLVIERSREELDKATSNLAKLTGERDSLALKLETLAEKLDRSEQGRNKLTEELHEVHKKLQEVRSQPDELTTKKLHSSDRQLEEFKLKLHEVESKRRQCLNELELTKGKLSDSRQHSSELRRRCEQQQKALDELRENKDKELSKLRVDLNFEQYNRQVAVKGIERELKSSLRELEAMKYRFSKRLDVSSGRKKLQKETGGEDSIQGCKRFESSPSTTATTTNGNRVQFADLAANQRVQPALPPDPPHAQTLERQQRRVAKLIAGPTSSPGDTC